MKKRRFAEGGFNDYEGALGEGTDTPDKALARKAAMSSLASSDKAAGLASTKGQDVGFFKRLSMGNIDAPGSEASNSFGAGKGSSDRMAQAANQDPPVRSVQRISAPAPPRPAPVVSEPTPTGDLGEIKDEAGTVSRFRRNTETGEAYDPGSATDKKPVAVKKPIAKPPIRRPVKDPTAGEAKEGPAAQLAADKMGDTNPRDAEKGMSRGRRAPTGEIANLDSRAVRDRKTAQMMMSQDEKLRKKRAAERLGIDTYGMKKGGSIKAYASGGSVSSRADGCAQRGKTKGMMR